MHFDETFPHSYLVDIEPDWPGVKEPVLDFVAENPILGCRSPERLNLRFYPDKGACWTGRFEHGAGATRDSSGPYLTKICSTPDPSICCVVANGLGYWVDISKQTAVLIPFVPILQVFSAEKERLLLFADFQKVVAYQGTACCWTTEFSFSDDAFVETVRDGVAVVRGFYLGDLDVYRYFSMKDGRELSS
ncbi:MAG TPA: hypothetical protein VIX90_00825 [Edaphobacter sp.]